MPNPVEESNEIFEDIIFEVERDPFKVKDENFNVDERENFDEKWERLAKKQFGETETLRQDLLVEFRSAIEEKKLAVPTDSYNFMIKMLRAGNFTVEGGMMVLENYLCLMLENPSYFQKARRRADWQTENWFSFQMGQVLPHRDKHGRRVYLMRAGPWVPEEMSYRDLFCANYLICEMMALEEKTQLAGVTCVLDCKGYTFHHVKSMSIEDFGICAKFINRGFPLFFRSFHVINAGWVAQLGYNICKNFTTKEVREVIQFHPDYASLHEHIPAEILPLEYGGTQGPLNNAKTLEAVEKMDLYFKRIKAFDEKAQEEEV